MRKSSLLFVWSFSLSPLALAASPPTTAPSVPAGGAPDSLDILKGRPDIKPDAEKQINSALLGTPYEDQSAGIAVAPPAGCKKIDRVGAGDELVAYVNEQKDWMFKVLRLSF